MAEVGHSFLELVGYFDDLSLILWSEAHQKLSLVEFHKVFFGVDTGLTEVIFLVVLYNLSNNPIIKISILHQLTLLYLMPLHILLQIHIEVRQL